MKRFCALILTAVLLLSLLPAATASAAEYATVVGGWLRLRSGPSTDYSTISSYYTGTTVEILGTSGSWYRVRTPDHLEGYMLSSYLQKGSTPTPSGDTAYVTSYNGYGVRLRKGPSTAYARIRTYAVGTQVTVLEWGTTWSYININGTVGYMMTQFLDSSYHPDEPVICYATIWSRNGYGVRLRRGPSKSYGKIGVYSVGTTVAVLEKGPVWDRVRIGSRVGYMMNEFLEYHQTNEITSVSINNLKPVVGNVLSMAAVSPSSATVSYEWLVGGAVKATTSTYTVQDADVDKTIQLRVTGTGSYRGTATSAATAIVLRATELQNATLNTTAPVVGTKLAIETLTPQNATIAYAWTIDDKQVSNASTYTATANDVGKSITLTISGVSPYTGSITLYTSAVQSSGQLTSVTIKNKTNDQAQAPRVGDVLEADVIPHGASVTYEWTNGNTTSSVLSNSSTYTVQSSDEGYFISVKVTGTGGFASSVVNNSTLTVVGKPIVDSVTVDPSSLSLVKGATATFTAKVEKPEGGSATNEVTWSLSGAQGNETTIDQTGKLTLSPNESASIITVIATSKDDTSKKGQATVTVQALPTLTLEVPATANAGEKITAKANVTGLTDPMVSWSIILADSSTIKDSGTTVQFDAPATAQTITIIAQLDAYPSIRKETTCEIKATDAGGGNEGGSTGVLSLANNELTIPEGNDTATVTLNNTSDKEITLKSASFQDKLLELKTPVATDTKIAAGTNLPLEVGVASTKEKSAVPAANAVADTLVITYTVGEDTTVQTINLGLAVTPAGEPAPEGGDKDPEQPAPAAPTITFPDNSNPVTLSNIDKTSETFTVTTDSESEVAVSAQLSGNDTDCFTVSPESAQATKDASASFTVSLSTAFAEHASGEVTATLTLSAGESSKAYTLNATVPVKEEAPKNEGEGTEETEKKDEEQFVANPAWSVSPGASSIANEWTYTVQNTGNVDLTITPSSPSETGFAWTSSTSAMTVAPEGSITLTLTYSGTETKEGVQVSISAAPGNLTFTDQNTISTTGTGSDLPKE